MPVLIDFVFFVLEKSSSCLKI